MVDRPLLSKKVAAVRDAVARARAKLPASETDFLADRDAREIVLLNLFVALQEAIDLATHWLSDEGWDVPGSYREVFAALADHGVADRALATRLADAAGFRNLVAHRYGIIEWRRVYGAAPTLAGDLEAFCDSLARRAEAGSPR